MADRSENSKHCVTIQKFHSEYRVSREHPAPEEVQGRLDAAAIHDLKPILESALTPLFNGSDSGVWLIRRLELEMAVNAAWERDQIARTWARQIAQEISLTMRDGGDGVNVLWFPDRVAFLARFLVDVEAGIAWGKWQYYSYEGLKALPVSATLRSALLDSPEQGQAALLQLDRGERKGVLKALTRQDASRVLAGIAEASPASDEMLCFQSAWAAWEGLEWGELSAGDEPYHALELFLAALLESGKPGGLALRAAALALLRLARLIVRKEVPDSVALLNALMRRDMAILYALAGSDAETLFPLTRCPTEWVKGVGQALKERAGFAEAERNAASSAGPRYTPYGGAFVLLPFLNSLPLAEAVKGWIDTEYAAAISLARFLILMKCLGNPRAYNTFYDPVLRDIMGIVPEVSLTLVADWQKQIREPQIRQFENVLAQPQVDTDGQGTPFYILAEGFARGGRIAVLLGGERGKWRLIHTFRPYAIVTLLNRVKFLLQDEEEAVVLCSPVFGAALRATLKKAVVLDLGSGEASALITQEPLLAEIVARLGALSGDLNYLLCPAEFGLTRRVDRVLSVAAQNMMRDFAGRLAGFAYSSLPYLFQNFLAFTGSIEEETERQIVRLGSPPLALILNMSGMNSSVYSVDWLDERPFALFSQEA